MFISTVSNTDVEVSGVDQRLAFCTTFVAYGEELDKISAKTWNMFCPARRRKHQRYYCVSRLPITPFRSCNRGNQCWTQGRQRSSPTNPTQDLLPWKMREMQNIKDHIRTCCAKGCSTGLMWSVVVQFQWCRTRIPFVQKASVRGSPSCACAYESNDWWENTPTLLLVLRNKHWICSQLNSHKKEHNFFSQINGSNRWLYWEALSGMKFCEWNLKIDWKSNQLAYSIIWITNDSSSHMRESGPAFYQQ